MLSAKRASQRMSTATTLDFSSVGNVDFSTKSIVVRARNEDDMEGVLSEEDIPSIHQLHLSMDNGGRVKRTIICNTMVAYEMQQQASKSDGRQVFQICARTVEGKAVFPLSEFTACVQIVATHMAQNVAVHGGDEEARFSRLGFWSPRIKLLYARALTAYTQACNREGADPSMMVDEVFVTAQVSVRPFSLSLSLCAYPFSSMGTCQVRVCKGTRPESFLHDFQLSKDPRGLTRLITPPIADVILVDPATKRLSEGLVSNFFATRFNGRRDSDRTRYTDYTLVCAPLETIHCGALAERVWAICQRDGIQVTFGGPSLSDAVAGRWSGAFIVNTAYHVLPIDTMHLTDRNSTAVEFGVCPLVAHLQEQLLLERHAPAPAFL
ncbi:hypothetical protein GGH19_000034 [Coemansia sp. RSA 1807]|nr:hypothetical protein LPJ62_000235 [Coemansia sp. RSA 2167]KAJ2133587.1 hypothetical protein GGF48_000090 [Coemansia sp. RSA 921]KAJ2578932.1 hypothetical protein GGH19_000034 [Coemansia sp. RSA 1807]